MNNNGNFNPNGNGQQFDQQQNNQQQYNPQFNNQQNNQQQYNPQFNNQFNNQFNKAPDGKGMSIAALVLGIVSCFFSSFLAAAFPVNLVFLACGIIGIALAVIGRNKSIACYGRPSGMANAGLVLSIIGTALSALFIVSCLACVGCAAAELDALNSIDSWY